MRKSHAADWASDAPTPAQLKEFFAQVESGKVTRTRLQVFLRGRNGNTKVSHTMARAIMGENMLGIEEVTEHIGGYLPHQLRELENIPFTEEVLEECKDTHVLIAGYPVSVMGLHGKFSALFYSKSEPWYANQVFAREDNKVGLRWYLIRKDAVPNSTSQTYADQCKLLGEDEEVPRACEVVYMTILYYLARKVRLFERIYVRTNDVTSDGYRVYVGGFDGRGLGVSYWDDDSRYDRVGVSSSRKFPR